MNRAPRSARGGLFRLAGSASVTGGRGQSRLRATRDWPGAGIQDVPGYDAGDGVPATSRTQWCHHRRTAGTAKHAPSGDVLLQAVEAPARAWVLNGLFSKGRNLECYRYRCPPVWHYGDANLTHHPPG